MRDDVLRIPFCFSYRAASVMSDLDYRDDLARVDLESLTAPLQTAEVLRSLAAVNTTSNALHLSRLKNFAKSVGVIPTAVDAASTTRTVWSLIREPRILQRPHMETVVALAGTRVCVLPDGRLASASDDGMVCVWDLEGNVVRVLNHDDETPVTGLCALPDGRLVSSGIDGAACVWDLTRSEGEEKVKAFQHEIGVSSVCVLPDGRLVFAGVEDMVYVWDLRRAEDDEEYEPDRTLDITQPNSVCTLSDGRIACGLEDLTIRVYDLTRAEGDEEVKVLQGHSENDGGVALLNLCALPDGRLTSAGSDGTVRVWDLTRADGDEEVKVLRGHTDVVSGVCVLPNGRLASTSWDDTTRIWDMTRPEGNEEVMVIKGRGDRAIASLPDGRLAQTGTSHDRRQVNVWVPV